MCAHPEVSVPAPQRATLGVECDPAAAARVADADLGSSRTVVSETSSTDAYSKSDIKWFHGHGGAKQQ